MRRVSIFCFVVLALTVAFWNAPAQAQPVTDWYWAQVDMTGFVDPAFSGGSGYNGGQWYYYPDTGWWNEWFYNDPFDPERKKEIEVFMIIEPLQPGIRSWATIAINWSTDEWAATGDPNPPLPPFLPGDEDRFIGRHTIYDGPVQFGQIIQERMYILDYNPEWVSIDIQGMNFIIMTGSTIVHECQPVKWRQLPDITPNGIDIKVDDQHWLGDDFKCITTGPLTGIHFWVSYLWDNYADYAIDTIHVEIYDDDPAGPGGTDPYNTHSMPDQSLWARDFTRAEFIQRLYAVVDQGDPPGEYWWDPATAGGLIQAADQNIYQIDIDISPDDTFTQMGTPDDPKIYWLVIQIHKNPNYWGEIGWKTRQWPQHFMDDAVFDIGSELPRIWKELRYPPGHPYHELEKNSIDLAFVIQGEEEKRFEPVKWSQPPVLAPDPVQPYEPLYLGWDEESVFTPQPSAAQARPFCADDFYCLGPKPVTKIHWWGSFQYWAQPEIPDATLLPQAFQIGFWTDVPAHTNPDVPYSHPGEMVWEIYCYDYQLEFYGWDMNPWTGLYEAKFQFNQDFKPEEWFHQDRENEIYWVSIAADYGDWVTDPQYIWGWETRPHFYQDDAVKIFPNQPVIPHLGYVLDPHIDEVYEIIHPDGTSWDLAYELGTDPNYIKWAQRFDPRWDWNTDIMSQARYDPATPEQKLVIFEAVVADDWPCRDERPILAVEWWGSYLGFDGSPGLIPPRRPDFFLLTIWTDMPANDPANPKPYSHPDQLIWTYRAYNYVQVPVGKETMNNEVVFQYFVNLPNEKFFYQEPDPDNPNADQRIYWLSVVAVYPDGIDLNYNWGWTNHKHVFMDDAAYDDVPISPVDPWQFDWKELQNPTSTETWDMSFVLETTPGKEEKRFEPVKWSQPPVPDPQFPPEEPWYLGWDEKSVVTPHLPVVQPQPFCADDFYCLGPKPVTKIHWWGSFEYWEIEEIPPLDQLPQAFQIGFWTDVPADDSTNPLGYSYPGEMVWEIYCYDYQLEFYGWDMNPWTGLYEAKFQFLQDFKPEEWFHQLRENEIYWVSIAADYGDWATDPQYIWGWETRPHFYQDDAVRIYPLQANIPPHPGYVLDPHFDIIEEIIHPDGTSWDLAYELGTDPAYIKWAQRFDPDWPGNDDIISEGRYDDLSADQRIVSVSQVVADDWPCRNPWPVTSIEWWGSYLGYNGVPGIALPVQPDFFLLSIWTDKPADPVDPDPYSRPEGLVWSYRADNYVEVAVGQETMSGDVVYKYYVNLPSEDFFFQEPDPDNPNNERIYWLSVLAVYPLSSTHQPYSWGWTNHKHVFMDDAVAGDPSGDPWWTNVFWWPLEDYLGNTADQSFVLETAPECMNATNPDYANWEFHGKPDCWCYTRQCRGDVDGLVLGPFWVSGNDLALFNAALNQIVLPPNGICSDVDHQQLGPFWVSGNDLAIFNYYLNQLAMNVPPCSGAGCNHDLAYDDGCDTNPLPNSEYNFWVSP